MNIKNETVYRHFKHNLTKYIAPHSFFVGHAAHCFVFLDKIFLHTDSSTI